MNHKPFSFLDVINDVFVVPAGNFFPVPIFFIASLILKRIDIVWCYMNMYIVW